MKEKGKGHPFAAHLAPDEEMLWLTTHAPPTGLRGLAQSFRIYVLIWLIFLAILVIFAQLMLPTQRGAFLSVMPSVLVIIGSGTIPYLGFSIPYFVWLSRQPFEYAFGVTNQRVLFCHLSDFWWISLRETTVRLSAPGTLSFEGCFPDWKKIEDAAEVQHIIEQAQFQLMQKSKHQS